MRLAKRAKLLLLPAMAVPLVLALYQYCWGEPYCERHIEALTLETGQWGIRLLLLSLLITTAAVSTPEESY